MDIGIDLRIINIEVIEDVNMIEFIPEKVGEKGNRPKTEPVEHQVYGKKCL